MKFLISCALISAAILSVSACLIAQEPAADEKPAAVKRTAAAEDEPDNLNYLPKPLSLIRTNVLDLEQSGYFVVDAVEFRTRQSGDEAIVWTVSTKKAVTCRHAEALLREFRDVRIYSTIEKQKLEVLHTLLAYSNRLTLGSSSNRVLVKDESFELWIDLPKTYLQKLISRDADTLVLRRWRY